MSAFAAAVAPQRAAQKQAAPEQAAPRRQLCLVAIGLVMVLTSGLGYSLLTTRPTYAESATVLFALPKYESSADAYSWLAPSLITTGGAFSQIVMNPQSRRQIRAVGGAGNYDLELINYYNQDYPDYSFPDATLTATAPDATETHWTFVVATRLLNRVLAQRQELAGVPAGDRVSARLIADSGTVVQTGSRKRALAGLMLLAIVAGSVAWRFVSRWIETALAA